MIEPIRLPSRQEREAMLLAAHFNPFNFRSDAVFIDLFTDSGTSAMSQGQWSAMMLGDEAYAGATSFYRFEEAVREVFGFPYVIPAHQGRAAENILFATLVRPGAIVPNNNHFDTTRAHVEFNQGIALDLVVPDATDLYSDYPFKGNIDLGKLGRVLATESKERIPMVMLTLTNNLSGGQPVSLENIRETAALCRTHGVPFYIDACRFAENAYFIKCREKGQSERSVADIVREIFSYADGCTVSAKKDCLANIGGFVACRDQGLAELLKHRLILFDGFSTYGGLAGRDLEAVACGMREALNEEYLRFRTEQVASFGKELLRAGIPIMQPVGGHAVYVDAKALLPNIPPAQFPAMATLAALYREGAVRSGEFGTAMIGPADPQTGELSLAGAELLRLAVPRRVYTKSHLDYVVEIFSRIKAQRESLKGLRFTYRAKTLRHFTARFEEISDKTAHP